MKSKLPRYRYMSSGFNIWTI